MQYAQPIYLLVLIVILVVGCAAEREGTLSVQPDSSFTLAEGDSVQLVDGETGFWIYLQSIQDSRCPVDVRCITAGKAVVILRLENKAAPVSFCKGADCGEENTEETFLIEHTNKRYNIVLEEVAPYPQEGSQTATKQTILKIKRATG